MSDTAPARRGPHGLRKPRLYYGKHRGRVESNLDPELTGRIQVSCPDVPGLRLGWAMPCVPYAGPGVGWFAIPPIGADVWVEFEGGDPSLPIWSGCFWQPGEIPVIGGDPGTKAFVTTACRMVMNDMIEENGGWSVEVNLAGGAVAGQEETQSATAEGADVTLAAGDVAADALSASFAANLAADAAGDAEVIVSQAEFAELEVESGDDTAAEEAGEAPGVYSIVINSTGIYLAVPEAEIWLTPVTIVATVPEATLTLTVAEVSAYVAESTLTVAPALISATCSPGSLEISAEAVMLSIGDTSVALSEPMVEIESDTVSVTGVLGVEGNSSFTGSLEVEGNTTLTGSLEVDGLNVEIAAPAIELTAVDINGAGIVSVEGDIEMDGAQVLAI